MADIKHFVPAIRCDRIHADHVLDVDRLVSKYRLVRPLVVHAIISRGPMRKDVESFLDLLADRLT